MAACAMEGDAMRACKLLFVCPILLALGCGSESLPTNPDAGPDVIVPQDVGVDTTVPIDTGIEDAAVDADGPEDAAADADVREDATMDAGPDDSGPGDAGPDPVPDAGDDDEDAGTDAGAEEDAGVDAGPPDPCEPQPGDETYHYVLRVIRIERDIDIEWDVALVTGGEAVGMDLDGVDGMTCDHVDFTWRGETGIDNNLAFLLDMFEALDSSFDANASAAEAIVEGDLLVVIRIDKWNGTADDDCVDVSLLAGLVPESVSDARAYLDMTGDDLLDPGVTLDLDAESFGEDMVPVVFFEAQRVEDGQVHTEPGAIPMSFPVSEDGAPLRFTLHEGQLRFGLTPTALTDGILAGAGEAEELADTFIEAFDAEPSFDDIFRQIIDDLADLWGDGVCDHVSAGFYFEGVDIASGVVR
jgi:hypothetical protein